MNIWGKLINVYKSTQFLVTYSNCLVYTINSPVLCNFELENNFRTPFKFQLPEHVYCTETRPYNQGARLTAYELVHDKLPATLILDNMVASLFKSRRVAAVVVGADRVAANGDTANKIGTYQIGVVAKYHDVPFYVAAPFTSIDLKIPSGDRIVIEERPDREMTHVGEHRIAAPGQYLSFSSHSDIISFHLYS